LFEDDAPANIELLKMKNPRWRGGFLNRLGRSQRVLTNATLPGTAKLCKRVEDDQAHTANPLPRSHSARGMGDIKADQFGRLSESGDQVRTHKRVRWRKPGGGKKRPGVLEATRSELVRGLEQRQGSLWMRIRYNVIVSGYPIARALTRVRGLRGDGAESLLALAVALLYLADVRTGYIGKPRPDGGRWDRYTLPDIAQLAYGAQGEAELRRARRALDMMVSLGWAFPTKQVRRHSTDDKGNALWRSEAAVRRLNLQRMCDMAGTSWLLKRDRIHADQAHGKGTASFEEARQRRRKAPEAESGRATGGEARNAPPATGDPHGGSNGQPQLIGNVLELFK
jgi:hypothetical protein